MSELVLIRDFQADDSDACRSLWAELTEHHRRIYQDATIGGEHPGRYFDTYLATPELTATWVAVDDGRVVGLTGLFDHGNFGEIEPVVVTEARRGHGIGRALIDHAIIEARSRGYTYLSIRPVARNRSAIAAFYAAGFHTLGGHVELTMDLVSRPHPWLHGGRLHDLVFDY